MPEIAPTTTGPVYFNNMCAPFCDTARRHPQRTALVFDEQVISNADVVARIDATIDALRSCGIATGDRVAFLGWNHPMLLIALLAAARMGAIFLPLNPRSTAAETRFILNDCDAAAIFAGAEFQAMIDGIRSDLPCRAYLGVDSGPGGWTVVDTGDLEGGNGISRHPIAPTKAGDVAVLMYTSGTTGRPKGVMITHGNVCATSFNIQSIMQLTLNSTLLAMTPMFHIFSLAYALMTLTVGGRTVILSAFDPDEVYRAIDRWAVSIFFGVPTMLQALEQHPSFATTDFRDITVIAAGAPVPVKMLETWGAIGARIMQGWGMTEGGGALLEADKGLEKIGSVGLPLPLTEIQLRAVDDDRVIRCSDEDGQIWMRGPTITKGYWGLRDETESAFDESGWFATGDVGRWDADGYLYIVDRIKDMIISGGVNVYPAEVEKVLSGHPEVASVAVIGLPDEKWGERVTAVVVPRHAGAVSADDIIAFCKASLSGYKTPRQVEFVDSLPVGPTGKVLKRNLREMYSQ